MIDRGTEIQQWREASGVTKAELARHLKIDRSYYGHLEKGRGLKPMGDVVYHRLHNAINEIWAQREQRREALSQAGGGCRG